MLQSTFGRATVGAAERPEDVVDQMTRTFSKVCSDGRIELASASAGRAVVAVTDVSFFDDSHHVGVYEGALRVAKAEDASVWIRRPSRRALELLCRWRT